MTTLTVTDWLDRFDRRLRVGLLGSPYEWARVDLENWRRQDLSVCLTAFAGTTDANEQDILFDMDTAAAEWSTTVRVQCNKFDTFECRIPRNRANLLKPDRIKSMFGQSVLCLAEKMLDRLHTHDNKYLEKETVISRFGSEILRVGNLLGKPHVHIENSALLYLIDTPWRNSAEIEFLVARSIPILQGDVLRKSFVQDQVYQVGTAVRGISNSGDAREMVRQLAWQLIESFDVRTALQVFQTGFEGFDFALVPNTIPSARPETGSQPEAA